MFMFIFATMQIFDPRTPSDVFFVCQEAEATELHVRIPRADGLGVWIARV